MLKQTNLTGTFMGVLKKGSTNCKVLWDDSDASVRWVLEGEHKSS